MIALDGRKSMQTRDDPLGWGGGGVTPSSKRQAPTSNHPAKTDKVVFVTTICQPTCLPGAQGRGVMTHVRVGDGERLGLWLKGISLRVLT